MNKITAEQCVRALKDIRLSTPAKTLADRLGSTSRAVATSLRQPCNDGRVSFTFKKGVMWYRFVRLSVKKGSSA